MYAKSTFLFWHLFAVSNFRQTVDFFGEGEYPKKFFLLRLGALMIQLIILYLV